MISIKQMEKTISLLLLVGTLFSAALVSIGGIAYLIQFGQQPLALEKFSLQYNNFMLIWQQAIALQPLSLIALGLIALIITQSLRILLLMGFYVVIRDYRFALMSMFIFFCLIWGMVVAT